MSARWAEIGLAYNTDTMPHVQIGAGRHFVHFVTSTRVASHHIAKQRLTGNSLIFVSTRVVYVEEVELGELVWLWMLKYSNNAQKACT